MDPAVVPYVAGGAILAVAVFMLVWRGMQESSRRQKIEALSFTLGFEFGAEDPSILESEISRLPLFTRGRRQKARNVLRRREGNSEITLFDYRYTTSSGKNASVHHQTVLAVRLPELALPELELRPEHLLDRIGGALGYQDIDFEGFPEFSRRYLLRGEDEPAVRQLFAPALLQALERRPGWSVEAHEGSLIVYRQGKRPKPQDLHTFLTEGQEIVRLLTGR